MSSNELNREVGEHDIRISRIEQDVGEMKPQVAAIAVWVAKQEALAEKTAQETESRHANYWGPLFSGIVAAVVGSVSAWMTTRF